MTDYDMCVNYILMQMWILVQIDVLRANKKASWWPNSTMTSSFNVMAMYWTGSFQPLGLQGPTVQYVDILPVS